MIVNLRGTSGSGKTHIVRELLKLYDAQWPVHNNGNEAQVQYHGPLRLEKPRKQPLFYFLDRGVDKPGAVLLGHYEGACGGCDTISALDTTFGLADEFASKGLDVIFEGLLASAEYRRSSELFKNHPHQIIRLMTSIDTCVAGIQARRDARGDERELNPRNTILKDKAIDSTIRRLAEEGVNIARTDRALGLQIARDALHV